MGLEAITNRGLAEVAPLAVALFLLSALFLHWGTVLCSVPGRAYYKAVLALLGAVVVVGLAATAMRVLTPAGGALAAAGLLASVRLVHQTDLWRAFVACLMGGVLTLVMLFLVVSALGRGG